MGEELNDGDGRVPGGAGYPEGWMTEAAACRRGWMPEGAAEAVSATA